MSTVKISELSIREQRSAFLSRDRSRNSSSGPSAARHSNLHILVLGSVWVRELGVGSTKPARVILAQAMQRAHDRNDFVSLHYRRALRSGPQVSSSKPVERPAQLRRTTGDRSAIPNTAASYAHRDLTQRYVTLRFVSAESAGHEWALQAPAVLEPLQLVADGLRSSGHAAHAEEA
jgi:hypothetical protein